MTSDPAALPGEEEQNPSRPTRWASVPFVLLIRAYQLFVSPLLPPSCRYYPSCSAYGLTAVRRFGPVRGGWLTARRLLRCNPWSSGGVDHVPRRGPDGRPIRDNEWRLHGGITPPGA